MDFYLDSRDFVEELEQRTFEEQEDKELADFEDINEYVESETSRFETYLLKEIPRNKWSLTIYKVISDLEILFSEFTPEYNPGLLIEEEIKEYKKRAKELGKDRNYYYMFEHIIDVLLELVFTFKVNEDGDKCLDEKIYIYCRYLGLIIEDISEDEGDPIEPQQSTLPMELDNDEAAKYFAKAIEIGLMDESDNWSKGKQLLSCFAREMSLRLGLNKAQNSDGTQRISWQPFEQLFKIDKGKLRSNYNDIQKTGQTPHGIELIDKIFE